MKERIDEWKGKDRQTVLTFCPTHSPCLFVCACHSFPKFLYPNPATDFFSFVSARHKRLQRDNYSVCIFIILSTFHNRFQRTSPPCLSMLSSVSTSVLFGNGSNNSRRGEERRGKESQVMFTC